MPEPQPKTEPPGSVAPARWGLRITIAVCIVVALAIWVDAALVRFIHEHRTAELHELALDLSKIADAELYASIALGIYSVNLIALSIPIVQSWRQLQERLVRASLVMIMTLLTGGLVTLVLKHCVARGRPALLVENGFYGISMPFTGSPFNSFPSSHAFTAFGVAFALSSILPAWRIPLLLAASAAGLSRIVALEHFPSDVIASAFIAAWCASIWSARILDPQSGWALRLPWRWRKA